MEEYNQSVIAKNVERLIEDSGLKKKVVAKRCGYSQQKLSNLLNGRATIKAVDVIVLAKGLGTTPNEICKV